MSDFSEMVDAHFEEQKKQSMPPITYARKRGRPPKNRETIEARAKEQPARHPVPGQPIHPRPGEPEEPPPDKEHNGEEEEPKEPEPQETDVSVSMTGKQFQMLMSTVIAEARKPVTDERKLAQTLRMKQHNREMRKDDLETKIMRFRACNHMQLPGSVMTGCAAIAWGTQSDGKKRGVCQHCNTQFSPVRSECIADEVWQAYQMLVRLPTHPAGDLQTIFTQA